MKSFALSLAGAAGLCAASSALAQAEPVLADVEVRARGAAATPEARAAQAVQAAVSYTHLTLPTIYSV